MSDAEDDVSHSTVDKFVAEKGTEVEDNKKSVEDLVISSTKDLWENDANNSEEKTENKDAQSEKLKIANFIENKGNTDVNVGIISTVDTTEDKSINDREDVSTEVKDVSTEKVKDVSTEKVKDVSIEEVEDKSDNEYDVISNKEYEGMSNEEYEEISDNEDKEISDNEGKEISEKEDKEISDNEGKEISEKEYKEISNQGDNEISDKGAEIGSKDVEDISYKEDCRNTDEDMSNKEEEINSKEEDMTNEEDESMSNKEEEINAKYEDMSKKEDKSMSSNEGEEMSSNEVEEMSSNEGEEMSHNEGQEMSHSEDENKSNEDEDMSNKEDEDMSNKEDEDMSSKEDEDMSNKGDEDMSNEGDEDLSNKEEDLNSKGDKNINNKKGKNINNKKGKNINNKEGKNNKNRKVKNTSKKEDKNINNRKGKNIMRTADKNDNQTVRKTRKSQLNDQNKNENRTANMARYPGRKRLANKRYISEDMITSKSDKSNSLSRDIPKGPKKRKLEDNSTHEMKKMRIDSDDSHSKRSLRNVKESNLGDKKKIGSKVKENPENSAETSIETSQPKTKQDVLRKLPFRKNRDAPDVPDLKPKFFWWNGVGEGVGMRLGDIPEIKDRINAAKSVRALYRVLFFQWPTNGQDIIKQILDFNGFPFDKSSYEYTKRQSLMKIMLDVTIANMCDILDLRKGNKQSMINNILNFLLTPYKKIDPSLDPSLQPVVVLERIELDDYLNQTSEDAKVKKVSGKRGRPARTNDDRIFELELVPVSPARVTRNAYLTKKLVKSPVLRKSMAGLKEDSIDDRPAVKQVDQSSKSISKEKKSEAKSKVTIKESKEISKGKKNKTEAKPDSSSKSTYEDNLSKMKGVKRKDFNDALKNKLQKHKKSSNDKKLEISADDSDDEMAIESDPCLADDIEMENVKTPQKSSPALKRKKKIKEEKTQENVKKAKENLKKAKEKESDNLASILSLSDSSETESAEETKLVTSARRKSIKNLQKRRGKPLGHFPKISECIQKANFSALQRLHILLFGASDKADHLKGNILAFGGFPFLEGSDEWKQKHFLLSLLAQNNLREYLNLLCIEYSDDDQPSMINKLMKFLAAPSEDTAENRPSEIEMEVVSSELINRSPAPSKGKPLKQKKQVKKTEKKKDEKKKDEKKKVPPRHRKVLMSEEEARRLEASFAREQRAMAREEKAPPPVVRQPPTPIAQVALPLANIHAQQKLKPKAQVPSLKPDPNQLNALLQTVYKRRALKAAGAVISTPNKGEKTKLADIENVKFLIVTGSFQDLELLHHLIYMSDVHKAKLRKNILDFDGFGFTEDSEQYQDRMEFLYSLGYDISKRISFLLGLSSMQTEIPLQDLNELIMYFLMSPCKSKQVVPIRQMPSDPILISDETHSVLKPALDINKSSYYRMITTPGAPTSNSKVLSSPTNVSFQTSTPAPRQKAKKSFHSSTLSPVKKVLLPPSQTTVTDAGLKKQVLGNNPFQDLPSITKVPTNVAVCNAPKTNVVLPNSSKSLNMKSVLKLPINPSTKVQLVNQVPSAPKFPGTAASNIGQIIQNPVIISQPTKVAIPPQKSVQAPVLQGSKMVNPSGYVSAPQEFLVQQQTPDGQQKTFKLIRLPPNHPLASVVGNQPPAQPTSPPQGQQHVLLAASAGPQIQKQVLLTSTTPQVQKQVLLTTASSETPKQIFLTSTVPPGLVLVNSSNLPLSNLQNIPNKVQTSSSTSDSPSDLSAKNQIEIIMPDAGEKLQTTGSNKDVAEILKSKTTSPTDEDLFKSIQEIILSSNFEDITLRNVIERVSAQFPDEDLTLRHNFMKDCVKKIIIGT